MAKEVLKFEDFISNSDPLHSTFFEQVNGMMVEKGYKIIVESKKTGYGLTYKDAKSKKSIMNFVKRKKGVYMRIYGKNTKAYMQLFDTLPESMKAEIKKGNDCKRFIDDDACSSRCVKGTEIMMDGILYGKCRYDALFFFLEPEKYEPLKEILSNEIV